MKSLVEKVDFSTIDKLSLNRCIELNIIPFEEDSKLKIFCETIKEELEENLKLIYGKELEWIELEEDFELLKEYFPREVEALDKKLIKYGVIEKASDIHFEPEGNGVNVRYRIDGSLIFKYKISYRFYRGLISRIKNLSNLDIAEKRLPQDGKFRAVINGEKFYLRVSFIKNIYDEKLVIRILKEDFISIDYREIAIGKGQKEILESLIKAREGIVIVNGPTGSGKSTTLYSILDVLKEDELNITTLEDPVEVSIKGITQIQLNKKIGLDFAKGLKHILRQDPDIIMIGEIRDEETAKMAIRASITGHKVYATIHARSAREIFFRLRDMGVNESLIKIALEGVISQRLVKKLCQCKEKHKFTIDGSEIEGYKRSGCSICNGTGYKGRVLVTAITKINEEITIENLLKNPKLLSNTLMKESLKRYLKDGIISEVQYIDFIESEGLAYEEKD